MPHLTTIWLIGSNKADKGPVTRLCGGRLCAWEGVSKKRVFEPANETKWGALLGGNLLVFVNQSGSNLAMTRLYGWAPKAQRALASVPKNRGHNTTI